MEISVNTRKAYSEVDEFLGLLSEEQRDKIPKKLRELFNEEKDREYIKGIDPKVPIKEQNLKEETLGIIALLNLQYWCKSEAEKERLQKVYLQNERTYQEELAQKYNPDNIFKKHNVKDDKKEEIAESKLAMVEYKESIFKKIMNKIRSIFYKK